MGRYEAGGIVGRVNARISRKTIHLIKIRIQLFNQGLIDYGQIFIKQFKMIRNHLTGKMNISISFSLRVYSFLDFS